MHGHHILLVSVELISILWKCGILDETFDNGSSTVSGSIVYEHNTEILVFLLKDGGNIGNCPVFGLVVVTRDHCTDRQLGIVVDVVFSLIVLSFFVCDWVSCEEIHLIQCCELFCYLSLSESYIGIDNSI